MTSSYSDHNLSEQITNSASRGTLRVFYGGDVSVRVDTQIETPTPVVRASREDDNRTAWAFFDGQSQNLAKNAAGH